MREERFNGIASKHRDDSVEDNLSHFEAMKAGTPDGQLWCLRAKISVDNPNKALRDPVIYRCNLTPHHHSGYVIALSMDRTMDIQSFLETSGRYIRPMILHAPLWTR